MYLLAWQILWKTFEFYDCWTFIKEQPLMVCSIMNIDLKLGFALTSLEIKIIHFYLGSWSLTSMQHLWNTLFWKLFSIKIMRKRGVLLLTLQLNLSCKGHFQLTIFICHECQRTSCMNCRVVIHSYTMQLITTQLQLYQNNSVPTTMQLHYNCTHDVMLMSLIVIHLLKFDTWHYEIFLT
jgi:hypothetical protein